MTAQIQATAMLFLILLMAGGPAAAHGVWAHVHVTGWAIQALPDGDLKDFLTSDPEVFNAALFGAVFTDSGYSPIGEGEAAAREYSEHLHWEPFVQDFVKRLRADDPPPWSDIESRKRVAFLMGCAAHGMQDEVFDSLFLYQVALHDGGGQDNADPAMDGFLKLDGKMEFFPVPYVPMELMLDLFSGLKHDVTEQVIQDAVGLITGAYVNDELGQMITQALGEKYEPELPWTRLNYLDPEIPGSLASEVPVTAGYLQAIWARLRGEFDSDAPLIGTFPADGGCLRGVNAQTPDPWVTLVYGTGVSKDSPDVTWFGIGGAGVPFKMKGTRWGANWTRLNRLIPDASLDAGGSYTVELAAGLNLIDGSKSAAPTSIAFGGSCPVELPGGDGIGQIEDAADVGPDQASSPDEGGTGCTAGNSTWSGWIVVCLVLLIPSVFRWKHAQVQ